jgi:hypothetical protein
MVKRKLRPDFVLHHMLCIYTPRVLSVLVPQTSFACSSFCNKQSKLRRYTYSMYFHSEIFVVPDNSFKLLASLGFFVGTIIFEEWREYCFFANVAIRNIWPSRRQHTYTAAKVMKSRAGTRNQL